MKIAVFLLHFLHENYKNGPNICTKLGVQHVNITSKHFSVNLSFCNFRCSFLPGKKKRLSGDKKLNLILRLLLLWLGDPPNLRTL